MQNLERVEPPTDFNFRVKTRWRNQTAVQPRLFARPVYWFAPAALAVVIGGYFAFNQTNSVETTRQQPANVNSIVAASNRSDNQAIAAAPFVEPAPSNNQTNARPTHSAAFKPRIEKNAAPLVSQTNVKPRLKTKPEQIFSQDSGGGSRDLSRSPAPPLLLPRGIPDRLQPAKKQDAAELLRTFGVETDTALRVIAVKPNSLAARNGLQTSDKIEKINNGAPNAIPTGELKQLNLTVNRNGQTREIKIQ